MQEKIALAIVGKLKQSIDDEVQYAIAKRTTKNIEAYQFVLKSYDASFNSKQRREYLHKAIELDPDFAYAYGSLAFSYSMSDEYDSARKYADEALKRDPELALPNIALARYYINNLEYEAAEKAFKNAIFNQPGLSGGHWAYAQYFRRLGRYREALERLKYAIEIDPFQAAYYGQIIAVYNNLDMDDEAFAAFEEGNRIFPDNWYIIQHLGRLYNRRGEHEKALEVFKRGNHHRLLNHRALTHAMMGDRDKAIATFNEIAKTTEPTILREAMLYIWLGETDKGLDLLEQVYEENTNRSSLQFIKCDFEYDPVRDHPRFKALMKKMGLPED